VRAKSEITMQPSGRTSTGAPITTLADQQRQREEQARIYTEFMAQQAAQQQAGPRDGMQQTGNARPPFPGSNPQMAEPGLLAQTMDSIRGFFGPSKSLTEMVPADKNPLAAAPGEGIGGRARREKIDEAVEGKRRR
jgi:hypothetical protein